MEEGENSGEVQVFTLNHNEWVQLGNTITAHLDEHLNGDSFGEGISLSSDGLQIAVACPPFYYKNGPFEYRESNGHVMMYELIGSSHVVPPSLLPTSTSDAKSLFINQTASPSNFPSQGSLSSPSTAPQQRP